MARIRGVEKGAESLLLRFAHRFSRKKMGTEIEPTAVMGHSSWVLCGVGAMEMSLARATRVPEGLKTLVDIKAALQVGCPF